MTRHLGSRPSLLEDPHGAFNSTLAQVGFECSKTGQWGPDEGVLSAPNNMVWGEVWDPEVWSTQIAIGGEAREFWLCLTPY